MPDMYGGIIAANPCGAVLLAPEPRKVSKTMLTVKLPSYNTHDPLQPIHLSR